MKINNLPTKIPVVPLRNEVVFPGMETPISIARIRSINAVAEAQKNEESPYVIVVTQKDDASSTELTDPSVDQLYTIGTLCRIQRILGGGAALRYQVLFLGIARFRIDRFEVIHEENKEESYLACMGENLADRASQNEDQIKLLTKDLSKAISEYSNYQAIDNLSLLKTAFQKEMEPITLSNLLASLVPLTINDKQKILEQSDVVERLNFLLKKVLEDVNAKKAQAAIHKRTIDQLNKTQKEIFLKEQMRAIQQELGQDNSSVRQEYEKKIKSAKMPQEVLKVAEDELKRLEQLHPSSSEYNVVRNYLEWLIAIPWNKNTKDRIELDQSSRILDEDHFGLDKPKQRILEYLAVAKVRNSLKGPILCLAGPPGVGKTSLGKSIARALGRKFARIALGGVRDEAEIRGHRRTYVGAMPGKIAQTLKRVEVNNPVILLDEIDKMGKGMQGDPAAAMLEVLDPEQNHTFTDHYLDVPMDLSKAFFICTANVLEDIPAPLRDRMEIIYVSGYTTNEKFHIAHDHLIPKMILENGLKTEQLKFSDAGLNLLIHNYTRESGVRELQRKIAAVCRSAVRELVEKKLNKIIVDEEKIKQYLGSSSFNYDKVDEKTLPGVATGLAWTSVGGDILAIEANKMEGQGRIILTGSLGDVMKESAQIALSYIRTHAKELDIKENFDKIDLHIHLPAGAIPKDGPSAGITLLTTLTSLLKNKPLKPYLAMTGEMSLKGKVLPVGGIKEKVIAAHRSGIKTILIPKANEDKLKDIPQEVLKDLNIKLVEHVDEVLNFALT
jgi:ATP-dependent Lon protease